MNIHDAPAREELFAMVWERPTTDVAKELGISDVALGKLCKWVFRLNSATPSIMI